MHPGSAHCIPLLTFVKYYLISPCTERRDFLWRWSWRPINIFQHGLICVARDGFATIFIAVNKATQQETALWLLISESGHQLACLQVDWLTHFVVAVIALSFSTFVLLWQKALSSLSPDKTPVSFLAIMTQNCYLTARPQASSQV